MCFSEEYTSCSWDLFSNDVCDKECDNKYCTQYPVEVDLEWRDPSDCLTDIGFACGVYTTDSGHCSNISAGFIDNITNMTCGIMGDSQYFRC